MERTQGLHRSITLNEVHGLEAALAKWVSVLASPPLLGLTGIAMLGMAFHRADVWLWAGFYAFSSIVAPILVLLWFMHTVDRRSMCWGRMRPIRARYLSGPSNPQQKR